MRPRSILPALALAALGCVTTPGEPVGIGPRVQFVAFEGQGDERVALFRLENAGPGVVDYLGADGSFPSIELQSWRDGEWKRTRFAWCADGLDWLPLAEGESVVIDVRPDAEELPLRLGISIRRGGRSEQIWSARVDG